jgi:hypothetical protein
MIVLHPATIKDNVATIPLLDGSNIEIPFHQEDGETQLRWTIKDGLALLDGTAYWTWPRNIINE